MGRQLRRGGRRRPPSRPRSSRASAPSSTATDLAEGAGRAGPGPGHRRPPARWAAASPSTAARLRQAGADAGDHEHPDDRARTCGWPPEADGEEATLVVAYLPVAKRQGHARLAQGSRIVAVAAAGASRRSGVEIHPHGEPLHIDDALFEGGEANTDRHAGGQAADRFSSRVTHDRQGQSRAARGAAAAVSKRRRLELARLAGAEIVSALGRNPQHPLQDQRRPGPRPGMAGIRSRRSTRRSNR